MGIHSPERSDSVLDCQNRPCTFT